MKKNNVLNFKLRIFQSETFVITDYWKYDDGHTGNPIWDNQYNVTLTRGTEDTFIENTTSANGSVRIDGFDGDYCIEFDFKSNGGCYPTFRQDSSQVGRLYWSSYEDNNYHTIRINVNGNTVTGTIDNTPFDTQTLIGVWNRFYISVSSNSSITYRNFKVYLI